MALPAELSALVLKKLILLALTLGLLAGCEKNADRPASMTVTPSATMSVPVATRDLSRPNSKQPCPTCPPQPTATATPAIGGRYKPIPFGETFQLVADEAKVFTLTLTKALRGPEAWLRIRDTNQFNDPPPAGMEYLLVYAEVDYVRGPANQALQLDDWDFRLVAQNRIFKPVAVVVPEPAFELEFFPGASGGGWMVWTVPVEDNSPLLAYGLDYDGSGGTYFLAVPEP